jgi:hypothetical protein
MAVGQRTPGLGLPEATAEYDQIVFQALLDHILELEERLFYRDGNVEISSETDASGLRSPDLIMTSPDGTRYAIRVSNVPGITFTAL